MYNNFYTNSTDIFPAQNIPLKEKLRTFSDKRKKTWGQLNMDALEAAGRAQYRHNLNLIENYEMIKGRFILSHYDDTECKSIIDQLSRDFELPNYLRHYDIISQVVNTLSGEWQKRPDMFKVVQMGEDAANEYLRKKIELTIESVVNAIDNEINQKLIAQGINPFIEEFNSEEEKVSYQEQIAQLKEGMTPKEIQEYMDTDFLTIAEEWGQHQKEYDRELFNLPEKEKVEFEDMLVADRCFRHFYITPTGYNQETWNPIHTFWHKSPDIYEVENGDFVGRIFKLSVSTIVDRYGSKMNTDDFEILMGEYKDKKSKWNDSKYDWVYDNYYVPFKDYPTFDLLRKSWNIDPAQAGPIPQIDWSGVSYFQPGQEGFYYVTEGYWKTIKTIYKLTYWDEDLEQIVVRLVDENYEIPKYFTESKELFSDDHPVDTYCETKVNEVWKGTKINTSSNSKQKKDIYIDVGPNDFQFKGDLNIYGCKLPVCGQIFNARNGTSMSLVDMMKPYQVGYNVAMNQLYQFMEKEIGVFMMFDVNMFVNSKDWGGEDSWEKWMLVAKNLGMLPADTSPQNVQQNLAASGGYLPKVIDMDMGSRMMSRMNLAQFFEQQALKQVGFNEYRTGAYSANSTAAGVEQGSQASYNQTESYFTQFSNYLRRTVGMALDIAQFSQSQKDDVTFTYIKSDFSRAFVKNVGSELSLANLGVLVSNSQENLRQLEMLRQYALNNNTAGVTPPDVADMITLNSPSAIKRKLEVSYNKFLEQQNQQNELAQQQMELQKQIEDQRIAKEDEHFYADLQSKMDIAKLKVYADTINTEDSVPEGPVDNSLQYDTLSTQTALKQREMENRVNKDRAELDYKNRKLNLEQQKLLTQLQIQNKETETARILKGQKPQQKKD